MPEPVLRTLSFLAVWVATVALLPAQSAPSPEAIREAVDKTFQDQRYQREIDGEFLFGNQDNTNPPIGPGFTIGDHRSAEDGRHEGGVTRLLRGSLWVGVAISLGILLFWAGQEAKRLRQMNPDRSIRRTEIPQDTPEQTLLHLEDADQAAATGDFTSATHLLLLAAIDTLKETGGTSIGRALTAREILGLFRSGSDVRKRLATLVVSVEFSLFGGTALTAEDYHRCREAALTILHGSEASG